MIVFKRRKTNTENPPGRLEVVEDVIKSFLQWIVVSICGFGYWMLVLFLVSIFLLNIWHITFEKLLRYGIILSVITSIIYAFVIIRRKLS